MNSGARRKSGRVAARRGLWRSLAAQLLQACGQLLGLLLLGERIAAGGQVTQEGLQGLGHPELRAIVEGPVGGARGVAFRGAFGPGDRCGRGCQEKEADEPTGGAHGFRVRPQDLGHDRGREHGAVHEGRRPPQPRVLAEGNDDDLRFFRFADEGLLSQGLLDGGQD